jgi:hypothetical protein
MSREALAMLKLFVNLHPVGVTTGIATTMCSMDGSLAIKYPGLYIIRILLFMVSSAHVAMLPAVQGASS